MNKTFDELKTEYRLGLHLRATTEFGVACLYFDGGHAIFLKEDDFPLNLYDLADAPGDVCRIPDDVMSEAMTSSSSPSTDAPGSLLALWKSEALTSTRQV